MSKRKIIVLCMVGILLSGFNDLLHANPLEKQAVTQQSRAIKGTVTDRTGESLIGVNVSIKGTTGGTITDVNGNFTLNVNLGDVLVISYIGYINQEVAVGNNSIFTIELKEDAKALDEVIVTGYAAVSRKNLTTSIVKVKTDEISKAATSNMSQMLLGRAAGLQATMSSAQPGGGVNITIRGGGSPIYVVDGVVMPGSSLESSSGQTGVPNNINRSGLSGVNPEDIESIEILKDASASIYGIASANGVILVTTKKGKEGKMKLTYDGNVSYVSNYKYLDALNAQDYMTYTNIFRKEQYLYNNSMGVYGSNSYNNGYTDVFSSSDITNAQNTDWADEILRSGSISTHNITIQGGTKDLSYYFSGNYYKQDGTIKHSDMERFILRSNVSARILPFLKFTSNINYNSNVNNNGMVGGTSNGAGTQANGALAAALSYPSSQPIKDADGNYTSFGLIPNAVSMLEITDVSKTENVNLNFTLDFDIIKNMLTGKLQYGYSKETATRDTYVPANVFFDQAYQSRGNLQNAFRAYSTMEGTINFNRSFFENKLQINALAGMGRYTTKTNGLGVSYKDINDAIGNNNIASATGTVRQTSYKTSDEKRSQFAMANFDILDRYVVAATIRRDGTDKFFKDKKYAWFPSVSVAWKVFNENFMENIDLINMLKVRGSFGVTGNDNLGTSLYGAYSAYNGHVLFDGGSSKYIPFYLSSLDYPNVTWEKTEMKNIGLDFSILNERISGSFDYFWNDVTDMLSRANTSGMSMLSTEPINGGHIRRYGWDATINTRNIESHDFKWNSMFSLSHYNAVWKERFPNYDYAEYQVKKNEPVNALYFYRTDGIVNSDKSNMPSYQPSAYQKPGSPIIKDLNGDGQISVDDVDMVNVVPDLYFGFGNTFTYKNWDLDIFMYSQLGLKKYNYVYTWADGTQLATQSSNQGNIIKKAYNSQTNPEGRLPGISYYLTTANLPGNTRTDVGYEDSSFLRIRNITLGYNFSKKNLGALSQYISQLRIYVDAQNPLTFTSFDVYDPEVYTGGDYKGGKAEYPMTRTFTVGAKISF